ncbi:MAG: pyridoxine 5'-phosphate synthase [Acidobacteria bacterium]|nr:MAG: pyridoxine 5'-phosphate synthase [Acidobacteriota bacterium]
MTARLSVNIDHVATLRQARRTVYPDPVEAARIAEKAGAAGITAHLRMDRRHIQDSDVERLRGAVKGKLNLEMSSAEEMARVALAVKPDQVTLVPERPEEVTTEGGLNLILYARRIAGVAERLAAAGIAVSLFVDPDPRQIQALIPLKDSGVTGFEINTDAYTRADDPAALEHGLRTDNVGPIAAIPGMEELNIGHFIIARAVIVGIDAAVREMLAAMGGGR